MSQHVWLIKKPDGEFRKIRTLRIGWATSQTQFRPSSVGEHLVRQAPHCHTRHHIHPAQRITLRGTDAPPELNAAMMASDVGLSETPN
jgi:hypothetical protein